MYFRVNGLALNATNLAGGQRPNTGFLAALGFVFATFQSLSVNLNCGSSTDCQSHVADKLKLDFSLSLNI